MLEDITIDTNVFMHANNRTDKHHDASYAFLEALRRCSTLLCVDKEFEFDDRDKTKSLIAREYLDNIPHGSFAFAILQSLALSKRIKICDVSVPDVIRRRIREIIHDPSDIKFARVAYNSSEQVLVSHDFKHFPKKRRRELREKVGVVVDVAEDSRSRL